MKRAVSLTLSLLMCGSVFSFASCEDETAPAHEHSYTSVVVNPTCTEKGYTKYTCECGDTYNGNEVNATGHSYTDEVVAPTCLADGYTKHTCACGDTYNDTTVAKNPENHTYETEVVPATCTEQGYTQYTCECGATYKDTYTATVEHDFSDGACACGLTQTMLDALTFNEFETYAEVADCDTGFIGEMIIPASYNGKPVTRIGAKAFNQCGNITSVKIPEGVTAIGASAFNLCDDLTSVEFPSTLVELGDYAFSNTGFTTIEIPSTIKIMKTSVFSGCNFDTASMAQYGNCYYLGNEDNPYMVLYQRVIDNATDYPIHEDATIIYDYAFRGATHDSFVMNKHIRLHDGITSIGDYAFNVSAHFFVDRVPSSLMHIGDGAFNNSNDRTSMGVQQSNEGWFMGNEENPYLILTTPSNWDSDGKYTVKAETKFIYDYAFKSNTSVKSIEFHDDVLEIGRYAFYDCAYLNKVILPKGLTELSPYLFYTTQSAFYPYYIVVPKTVKHVHENIFSSWNKLGTYVYFEGTKAEWNTVYVDTWSNTNYSANRIYYYSENEPPLNAGGTWWDGNYWHYVDGVPTAWIYTPPSA